MQWTIAGRDSCMDCPKQELDVQDHATSSSGKKATDCSWPITRTVQCRTYPASSCRMRPYFSSVWKVLPINASSVQSLIGRMVATASTGIKKQDCLSGFMPGSVTFNATSNSNRNEGSIPAGMYTQSYTMLAFCCKESSISRSVDVVLPRNQAFYLIAAQNGSCQSVKDMEASEETLAWSGVSVTVNGTVPKALGNNTLELTFCYYTPSPATVEQATGKLSLYETRIGNCWNYSYSRHWVILGYHSVLMFTFRSCTCVCSTTANGLCMYVYHYIIHNHTATQCNHIA